MISFVACCYGAKLCAHAARDFRLQHKYIFTVYLLTLNVHLLIGTCISRGTCIPGWEPLLFILLLNNKFVIFFCIKDLYDNLFYSNIVN